MVSEKKANNTMIGITDSRMPAKYTGKLDPEVFMSSLNRYGPDDRVG